MIVEWSEFKRFINERNADILEIEKDSSYYLFAHEENLQLECIVDKNPSDETDLIEFETHYLPTCNPYRKAFDDTGKPFARFAIANEGFMLSCLAMCFTTAKTNSLHCKNSDNITDTGYVNYKIFDVNGNETQDNTSAVKTQIDIEITKDFEMVGGKILQHTRPSEDIYGYMIGAPDVPEMYGGSKNICKGGFNFRFIESMYEIDGRAPKMMYYDATLHTNKIRLLFHHSAGFQHEFQFSLEYYR